MYKNLEEFVRGPLAICFNRLYGRRPGNGQGPFARFGARFLTIIGHPTAPGTVDRALKPRRSGLPRAR